MAECPICGSPLSEPEKETKTLVKEDKIVTGVFDMLTCTGCNHRFFEHWEITECDKPQPVKIIRVHRCSASSCPKYQRKNCIRLDYEAHELRGDYNFPDNCPLPNESDLYIKKEEN